MRTIWTAVFACIMEPLSGKTSGSYPSARTGSSIGPDASRQPTTARNPGGCRRRRSTNWRSAPPMKKRPTRCNTGMSVENMACFRVCIGVPNCESLDSGERFADDSAPCFQPGRVRRDDAGASDRGHRYGLRPPAAGGRPGRPSRHQGPGDGPPSSRHGPRSGVLEPDPQPLRAADPALADPRPRAAVAPASEHHHGDPAGVALPGPVGADPGDALHDEGGEDRGRPQLVVFAVGGAGAQVPLAKSVIAGLKRQILEGGLRLALVAGRRQDVASALSRALAANGLTGHSGAELLYESDVYAYFRRFNELLASADVLWSKPSELTFFAALGLPFIAAPPVGAHEACNLRWATDRGAALPQHDPEIAGDWLLEWEEDGVLASAAEAGRCLPQMGLSDLVDQVENA